LTPFYVTAGVLKLRIVSCNPISISILCESSDTESYAQKSIRKRRKRKGKRKEQEKEKAGNSSGKRKVRFEEEEEAVRRSGRVSKKTKKAKGAKTTL
jgi:hypothetical protein